MDSQSQCRFCKKDVPKAKPLQVGLVTLNTHIQCFTYAFLVFPAFRQKVCLAWEGVPTPIPELDIRGALFRRKDL